MIILLVSGDIENVSEKRAVRQQNVAIQAIIQNKARQSQSVGSVNSNVQQTEHTGRAEQSKSLDSQQTSEVEEQDDEEVEEVVNDTVEVREFGLLPRYNIYNRAERSGNSSTAVIFHHYSYLQLDFFLAVKCKKIYISNW